MFRLIKLDSAEIKSHIHIFEFISGKTIYIPATNP